VFLAGGLFGVSSLGDFCPHLEDVGIQVRRGADAAGWALEIRSVVHDLILQVQQVPQLARKRDGLPQSAAKARGAGSVRRVAARRLQRLQRLQNRGDLDHLELAIEVLLGQVLNVAVPARCGLQGVQALRE